MTDVRPHADGALRWVRSVAQATEGGLRWQEKGEPFDDLYAGTAGVLLGCAEARAAGWRSDDLDEIADGAVGRLRYLVDNPAVAELPDDGLFSGWAGVAEALRAWAVVTADASAHELAARTADVIAGRVLARPDDPARVTDVISGDAGTLLALLPHPRAHGAAQVLATDLIELAVADPPGLHWRMDAGHLALMPGFSHGTAGVAFALARAGASLGRSDLLGAAVRGAQALLAMGMTADGWQLPTITPRRPDQPRTSFGWCHGPAGTGRLFAALAALDRQPRWQTALRACMQALVDSGVPARRYPGFWDNLGRCCGTAAVGQFVIDRYVETGDPELLVFATALVDDVIARTTVSPEGAYWSHTEHRLPDPVLPPEPGLMQGAMGIAAWLMRYAAVVEAMPAPVVVDWI